MSSKIKNIIIFVVIGLVLVFVYIFFLKPAPDQGNLVSSTSTTTPGTGTATSPTDTVGQEFLSLLLSVKSIKLDDSIFSDTVFNGLHDSSIEIVGDGTEGRPNPFAPIGSDILSASPISSGVLTTTGSEAFTAGSSASTQ
jgi:hypothetical protein